MQPQARSGVSGPQHCGTSSADGLGLGEAAANVLAGYGDVSSLVDAVGMLMDMHGTLQVGCSSASRASRPGAICASHLDTSRRRMATMQGVGARHAHSSPPSPQDLPTDWLSELTSTQLAAAAELEERAAKLP